MASTDSGTHKPPAYLALTRKLAHSEKKVRDRTVRIVNKWLGHQPNVSEEDLRKLWQGLFFCTPSFLLQDDGMWHADKLIIQAEVAMNLASLMHALGSVEGSLRYFAAALWTLQQRWETVDKHRLDKFLSLLRHLLRQSLLVLARHQWRVEDIALWARYMTDLPYGSLASSDASRVLPLCPGIALHFADIFMDELKVATDTNVENDTLVMRMGAVNDLLEPFLDAVSRYPHKLVLNRIDSRILRPLVDKADRSHPPTSPLRFVDFAALSNRIFEFATSRETVDAHRGRLYGYRKTLKLLNVPNQNPTEGSLATTNGSSQAIPEQGKQKKARIEETEAESAEEIGHKVTEDQEQEEEEENGGEAENGESVENVTTGKRKAMLFATAKRIRTPQHTWIMAYRKKARTTADSADLESSSDNGSAAMESEASEAAPAKPNGTGTKQKKNRVRFSLESNSAKEFRKIDPPSMASSNNGISSPQTNRRPTGILKSPAKKSSSPLGRK